MPDLNWGALTIPVFVTIWGGGWASCYVILVKPMTERMNKLESKLDAVEAEQKAELAELKRQRMGQ